MIFMLGLHVSWPSENQAADARARPANRSSFQRRVPLAGTVVGIDPGHNGRN